MSETSTSSLTRLPSPTRIKAEHHIVLVDRTISRNASNLSLDAEISDSEGSVVTPGPGSLYRRVTNTSTGLRQTARNTYNKQKYARYGQDRYHVEEPAHAPIDESNAPAMPESVQQANARQRNYLNRAQSNLQAKKNKLLKRKKTLGKADERDTVIDVLYENQRGMFFFGIPKYSSASLLPADPKPWQNGQFRTAAVDIRNAQVPDPSWEWTWKSWYVDMSRDVDEEGWEYSFAFVGKKGQKFAWHGNHPWFHSFVRRRRWLRMRKRKDNVHRTQERSHELTSDYFTIHPKTVRDDDQDRTSTLVHARARLEPDFDVEKMEVFTIADLFLALRKSSVDREKISAIKKFTDGGGDELYYLSESMEDIMKNLIFQSSRRQLLDDLIARHHQLREEQKPLESHDHKDEEDKQEEHDRNARHAANLHKAIHAAEQQVRKLEYWSDIKGLTDTNEKEEAHNEPRFKNKQRASVGAPTLPSRTISSNSIAYDDLDSATPSQHRDVWFETSSKLTRSSKGKDSSAGETEPDHFETAPEYAGADEKSSQRSNKSKVSKGKGRSPALGLDGVAEELEAEAEEARDAVDAQLISQSTGSKLNGKRRSVQIVEPIAISTSTNGGKYDSEDEGADGTKSPIDREAAKTPDSVRKFMTEMRKPKNWIDQAFG
ncbi:Putative Peroxin/Ferlin domain-containing protein [Septoria linicola]|uniref:Peroxin/Ferlin domain-containing protein n=1 Tax=Septoria linicola TaxID=215465 RepID=A0A9Q9AZQ5_9PEZI|nr:Putative Peroxin/Ferlin domain-containing protein [Septoria linicola]